MTRRGGGGGTVEMADATTTGPPQPPQQQHPTEFKDVLAKTFKDMLVWASDPFSECSNRGTQNSSSSNSSNSNSNNSSNNSSSSSNNHGIAPGGSGGDERSSSNNNDAIEQKCAFMRFVDGLLNRPPPAPPAPVSPDDIPPYLPKSILRQKSRYPRSPKPRGRRRGKRSGGGGGRGGGGSGGRARATDGDDDGAGYAARTSGGGYGGLEGFAGFAGSDGLDGGICGVCGTDGSGGGGVGGGGDCPRRGAFATATAKAGVRWAPDVTAREKWGALPEVPTRDEWWALASIMSAPRTRSVCWGSSWKWTIPPYNPKPKPVPVPEPEPDPRIQYMPDLRRYAPETHREPLQEPESEVERNAVPETEPESQPEVELEAQSLREVQQPPLKPTRTVIVQNPRVFSRAARFAAEDDDDDDLFNGTGTGNVKRNLNGNYGNRNGSRSGNCPRIGGGNANGGGNTHFDGNGVGNGVVKDKVENDGQGVFGAGGRGRGGGGGPEAWDFMDGGRMTDITLVGINRVKARKAREAAELEDFAYDSDDTDDSDEEEEEEGGGGRAWTSYGYDGSMASLKSVDFSSSPSKNKERAPCPPSGVGLLREIKPSPAQWMTAQQLDEILGSTAGWKNKGMGGGGGGGRSGRNGFGSGSRMRAKFHQRTGSSGSSSSSGSSGRSSSSRSSRSNSSSNSSSSSSSGSDDDASREESLLSVKGAGDECKAGAEQKVDEWKVEDVAAEVCGNARFAAELFELAKAEHWAGLLFKRAYLNSQEG